MNIVFFLYVLWFLFVVKFSQNASLMDSGHVTISQLCGHSNVNGMYIICDGQKVATIIKDKIHVEFASQLDVLHLSNTSIRNKDCDLVDNIHN